VNARSGGRQARDDTIIELCEPSPSSPPATAARRCGSIPQVLEGARLDEAQLVRSVAREWDVHVDGLGFIPAGQDSYAWAYEVHGRPARFFLKVRLGPIDPATVLVPSYLRDRGLRSVVAPIPTASGAPWHELGDYRLLLYPFVAGATAARRGLSDAQWIAYGRFLSALHAVELPAKLADVVPAETFRTSRIAGLHAVTERVRQGHFDDAPKQAVARLWHQRAAQIATIARRTEELAPLAAAQEQPHVLCHADIHRANLIVDDDVDIHVVDWDQPIHAPRERDLMFVIGSSIAAAPPDDHQQALFWRGYGAIEVNWPILAYYRYDWAVQDLADFAARVFFRDDLGGRTKDVAAITLSHLFEPGDEVDMALASERHL